jgi:hypothetical protein
MSTPVLDKITSRVGEGPILRRIKEVVIKVKTRIKQVTKR